MHIIDNSCLALPPPEIQSAILAKTVNLKTTAIRLLLPSQSRPSISTLIDAVVLWLNGIDTWLEPTMSSAEFLDLIKPVTGTLMATKFQRLLFAESHSPSTSASPTESDFQYVGEMAGHHCLEFIEGMLSPQRLSACSGHDLQIFLLILSTSISAICDSRPVAYLQNVSFSIPISIYT